MKINFLLPPGGRSGGGHRVVSVYARFLLERGHDVTLVAPRPKAPSVKRRIKMALKGKVTPVNPDGGPGHLAGLQTVFCIAERAGYLRASDVPDADVQIATWWETAEWLATFAPEKGKHAYLIQGHEVFHTAATARIVATYLAPSKKIVVSNWLKNVLEKKYGTKGIEVISNAVDHRTFFPTSERIKADVPTFGFLHNETPVKNVKLAIDVANELKIRIPEVRFLVFGASPPSKELKLPHWIEFHQSPSQEEIRDIYNRCDGWLFTSISEGFGLPILESMACGTPVLATYAGAAPDIIQKDTGFLVDTSLVDFVDCAVGLSRMSKSKWKEVSDRSRAVAGKYAWRDSCSKFEKTISSIIK